MSTWAGTADPIPCFAVAPCAWHLDNRRPAPRVKILSSCSDVIIQHKSSPWFFPLEVWFNIKIIIATAIRFVKSFSRSCRGPSSGSAPQESEFAQRAASRIHGIAALATLLLPLRRPRCQSSLGTSGSNLTDHETQCHLWIRNVVSRKHDSVQVGNVVCPVKSNP